MRPVTVLLYDRRRTRHRLEGQLLNKRAQLPVFTIELKRKLALRGERLLSQSAKPQKDEERTSLLHADEKREKSVENGGQDGAKRKETEDVDGAHIGQGVDWSNL
jgi:hypothetical protein